MIVNNKHLNKIVIPCPAKSPVGEKVDDVGQKALGTPQKNERKKRGKDLYETFTITMVSVLTPMLLFSCLAQCFCFGQRDGRNRHSYEDYVNGH